MLGVDYQLRENMIAGVGLSRSTANTSFNGLASGDHKLTTQGIHPYFGWRAPDDSRLWATLGIGAGDLESRTDGSPTSYEDSLSWHSLALGGAKPISSLGPFSLDLIADGQHTQMKAGSSADTGRVRFGVQLGHNLTLGEGRSMDATIEVTARHDFGDVLAGLGMELGGGLNLAFPALGLKVDLNIRALLTHAKDVEEWGLDGGVQWTQRSDGRGFALTFKPQWGNTNSRQRQLWDNGLARNLPGPSSQQMPGGRYGLELKYALPIMNGEEVLTLFTSSDLTGNDDRIRLGWDLKLGQDLSAEYEATMQSRQQQDLEHRFQLRYQRRF